MKEKITYAQDVLLEISNELLEAKKSIQHDPLDDEVAQENKFATSEALSFAARIIHRKFDELDQDKK